MEETNFSIRLKHFMESVGLTSSQLADKCQIPRPSMSQILSGRNKKISDTIVGQIHAAFPQLSVLWLMFDEGEMFLPRLGADVAETVSTIDSPADYGSSSHSDGASSISDADSRDNDRIPFDSHAFGVAFTGGNDAITDSDSLKSGSQNPESRMSARAPREYSKENGLENAQDDGLDRVNKGVTDDLRTIALMRQIENMRANPRKVTQITVYYDDSTFETFFPSSSGSRR